jgi:D-serine deaminase-like pyridoxal phosphate-dependent protein
MDSCYRIDDAETIFSPALVLYKELIESNLRRMIEVAGTAAKLRPHVKTHKMREIVAMELAMGISKHKCATIAEAELLASTGARDVLIAYPMVGPNQQRLVRLAQKYPACHFIVIADDPEPARALSGVVAAAGVEVSVMLDVDVGQHRTGLPLDDRALNLYRLIAELPGLRPGGLHVYDGHNNQERAAEREAAVRELLEAVFSFRQQLERAGLEVPRIVCGGTPTFPIFAKVPGVECAPGTCVLHDQGYGTRYPELGFQRAAMLLTRVVSRPSDNRMCLDLGYKAVASDPKGDRLALLDLPDARFVLQNEEHLVVETPRAADYRPGDALLACPTHICPTCALHKEAYVIEHGRVAGRWAVAARDRQLSV